MCILAKAINLLVSVTALDQTFTNGLSLFGTPDAPLCPNSSQMVFLQTLFRGVRIPRETLIHATTRQTPAGRANMTLLFTERF